MNKQRLLNSLDELSNTCNDSLGIGVTRFSWSNADRKARSWLMNELQNIELKPWTDGIGNIHAIYKGNSNAPRIMTGSHLDTVQYGGAYDGTYGVVASLEVLRTFHEEKFIPSCDIEFIAFAEEEGSNFANTCLGSKAICGQIDETGLKALHNDKDSAWNTLKAFGLNPENLPNEQIESTTIKVFLEIHIEQNSILEQANIPVGIVTGISGMYLHKISITGVSDHAASPMYGRKDAMACFAEIAYSMENLWKKTLLADDFSCTIGKIECEPNVGIIIPQNISFTIDVRHIDTNILAQGWAQIENLLEEITNIRGLSLSIERLSASGGVAMDTIIQETFAQAALKHNFKFMHLKSGPAHDAASMGHKVPVGLLFVPSIKGLSHCAQENTSPENLAIGAIILEESIRILCTQ